ncbi:helix-turn-helix transcriptional regulator [Haladaptatus sp. GCM10025707]|uniref:helix-turn-helix transcriptional regulator n=1 Tax=unclassified Haladaptatus TaxID=2622732 RepID=UPI0023E78D2B|nr:MULTISPECIES: hypothetical protein [unclassified Haladaptatus]
MAELAAGPRTRLELRDATSASKATISRLLGAFENRGWVARRGEQYHLTELGAYVSTALGEFHGRMETAKNLQGLNSALPLERLGLEIDDLTGATVTSPTASNPLAAMVRLRELELGSFKSLGLASLFPEPCIDARHAAVVGDSQRFEVVVSPTVVEAALSSNCSHKFMELVDADRCEVHLYHGSIEPLASVNDGTACLVVRDKKTDAISLVETPNPTIVGIVSDAFEEYRSQATLLTTDSIRRIFEDDAPVA